MIKNQKQASAARQQLKELTQKKSDFIRDSPNFSKKVELGIRSIDSLIQEIQDELDVYYGLIQGNFHILQPKSLIDIPNILIAARLAQNLSQKDLGDLVGLHEQQIQRYESTDYETASWPRIFEIAFALNLKFSFEKIIIINPEVENNFQIPYDLSSEKVDFFEKHVKANGSLII